MKGFVAACLAAVPDLQGLPLARPLQLFISYDEEIGCHGARRLIRDLDESRLRPDLWAAGEPSGMKPILAHKGKLNVNITVRGLPGHSSEPAKGVDAVQAAGSNSAGKAARGTEGGFFEQAGIPAIIRGPGHIAQAHQPDEWIAESELHACDKFICRLAGRLLV